MKLLGQPITRIVILETLALTLAGIAVVGALFLGIGS
jgi:hypothetical protein